MHNRLNVLITSVSAKVQLVEAFKAALAPIGGKVIGADIDPDSTAARFVDQFEAVPADSDPGFNARLLDICTRHDIGLIIPTRDSEMDALMTLAPEFAARGIMLPLPAPDALAVCSGKRAFHDYCLANGFPVLPAIDPDKITGYPVFVRLEGHIAGLRAFRIDRPDQLALLRALDGDFLCQPLCRLQEYSCDILSDFDGHALQAVVRRRLKLVRGESWRSEVVALPTLEKLVMDLANSLKLRGHNLAQAFVGDDGTQYLIEVNTRFGGCSGLSIKAGLNSPDRMVKLLTGRAAAARAPHPIKLGMLSYRYALDLTEEP